MKKVGYLLVCVFLVAISCQRSGKTRHVIINDSLFQTIIIDPDDMDKTKPFEISKIGDNVEYTLLQTEDSLLIGEIRKLIVWNDNFFIWDSLSETIFCFGLDGKFLYKISKQGTGPGEYSCISDFTINQKTGNIFIYSDMDRGFYEYSKDGYFIRKIQSPIVLSSFGILNNAICCYIGKLPNMDFYNKTYPDQYRYLVLNDSKPNWEQLSYKYNEEILRIPLSNSNFSFYKDTMLLTEFLKPEIYSIDSTGILRPKYRIEFSTNKYNPSFDSDIDLERMESEKKNGNFTQLFGQLFETDKYIFFNYARGLIGMAYVDKRDHTVYNAGYFIFDDYNQNTLPPSIYFVNEEYMYMVAELGILLKKQSKKAFSPNLTNVIETMREFDNPVIIKIKLR